MQEMNASEFRQKCLALMDDLPGEGILITRHGRPLAKLTPVHPSNADLIGSVPDLVVNPQDDLLSAGIEWDAQS